VKAVARILADRFQHPITFAAIVGDDQRFVDKSSQQIEDLALGDAVTGRDRLGRIERASAHKHREPSEQCLFRIVEKIVAPIDQLLTRQHRATDTDQKPEPVA
jgi:hypothetical protein